MMKSRFIEERIMAQTNPHCTDKVFIRKLKLEVTGTLTRNYQQQKYTYNCASVHHNFLDQKTWLLLEAPSSWVTWLVAVQRYGGSFSTTMGMLLDLRKGLSNVRKGLDARIS
jgi:hypothetical protein